MLNYDLNTSPSAKLELNKELLMCLENGGRCLSSEQDSHINILNRLHHIFLIDTLSDVLLH